MRKTIRSPMPGNDISEADAARVRSISALERLLAYAESEAVALHQRPTAAWVRMARVLLLRRTRASGAIDRVGFLQSASALEGVLEYALLDAIDLRRRGVAALIRMAIVTLRMGRDFAEETTRQMSTAQPSQDDAQRGD